MPAMFLKVHNYSFIILCDSTANYMCDMMWCTVVCVRSLVSVDLRYCAVVCVAFHLLESVSVVVI